MVTESERACRVLRPLLFELGHTHRSAHALPPRSAMCLGRVLVGPRLSMSLQSLTQHENTAPVLFPPSTYSYTVPYG